MARHRRDYETGPNAHLHGKLKASTSRKIRGTDPATCEMDYTSDEFEFLKAVQEFQARTGRRYPAHTEYLAIVRSLGYSKPVKSASA
jgi:hypothetical protein